MNPTDNKSKDKRSSIRIPLTEQTCYMQSIKYGRQLVELKDITNKGMFIGCDKFHKPGETVSFEFILPGDLGELYILAQVKRLQWTKSKKKKWDYTGMGLEFCVVDQAKQRTLNSYVVYLRNRQIIQISQRIIEQFFGPRGPNERV